MILMEGLMLVPPERGSIIGRASWKSRYVVLGSGAHLQTQTELLEKSSSKRGKGSSSKGVSRKPSLAEIGRSTHEGLYISIYKAKGDWEYIAQHPISAFKSCDIRSLSHRKQSPPLPTLMLELKPDSITEKQRKRRSSRTAGLSGKDAQWADTLLFRSVPEERHSIYDWQIMVNPRLETELEESPMSPLSPIFTSFTNPFAAREARPPSRQGRMDQPIRTAFQTMGTYVQTPRDRPSALISPSPSLRSRRSDLSSQASSSHPPMGFTAIQNYTSTLPSDLPSPVSVNNYDNFIEGWTSAQGRSSALSHHTRGSNSIASVPALTSPMSVASPGARETILDRAFQMRCIPGSEKLQDDEDKISSIARFEALMRDIDERKLHETATPPIEGSEQYKSGWELDEESEESDIETASNTLDEDVTIPTPAQRALDYIAGRRTPGSRPISPRSPSIPFMNPQAMNALHSGSTSASQSISSTNGAGLRPRTGTTSHIRKNSRPTSFALPSRAMSTATISNLKDSSSNGSSNLVSKQEKDKRRSSTSISQKRLSFQEFARRLSSTSSLLLVQTNASSNSGDRGSRRGSTDTGAVGSVRSHLEEEDEQIRRRTVRSSNGLTLRGGDVAKREGRVGLKGHGVLGEGGFV